VIFKEYIPNKCVLASNFLNSVTQLDTRMTGSILGEGQTVYGTARDSNPCDSDRTDKEDRRTWPQIIHGQFLSALNYLMTWPRNRLTVMALSALKTSKLKSRDIRIRTRAALMAILWREKRDICMLTNIHNAPAKGNFCNEGEKP